jgi:soluble lytic murein transglycosylase
MFRFFSIKKKNAFYLAKLFLLIVFATFSFEGKSFAKNTDKNSSNNQSAKKSDNSSTNSKSQNKKESKKKSQKKDQTNNNEKSKKQNSIKSNFNSKNINIAKKLWSNIDQEQFSILSKIYQLAENKQFSEAYNFAKLYQRIISSNHNYDENDVIKSKPDFSQEIMNIILWKKFSSNDLNYKNTSFSDISRFTADNSFYPNLSELRRNTEKVAIANNEPYQTSEQYFKLNPTASTESKIFLLNSKIKYLRQISEENEKIELTNQIKHLISDIWINADFNIKEENLFFEKYSKQLSQEDHIKKTDRLFWQEKFEEGKRMFSKIDSDYRSLYEAVIESSNSNHDIEKIIASIPRSLRDSEIILYKKIIFYKGKNDLDEIVDLLIELPDDLKYPETWWNLRHLYAREMIKKKKYKAAYYILAKHGLSVSSKNFWEAEWISGWVALRFLDKPKEALLHFDKMFKNVNQPVTLARASYWIAMTYEAMDDKKQAIIWYKNAAQYPLFFYGQLAITKHRKLDSIGSKYDIILPKDPDILVGDMKAISNSKSAKIAYLLALFGDKKSAIQIFENLIKNSDSSGQIALIMKIVDEFNDSVMSNKITQAGARKNVFFIKDKFKIIKEIENDENAPLVHAIIKQESGFMQSAVSRVGAIGYMQLMPATAQIVSKQIGVPYNNERLRTDLKYNVALGTFYIKQLIDKFDGSEMLAIASYNAGPNNAERWMREFYDPREENDLDKTVDWIELITYSETRNYVQRITENLLVYKYIMSRTNYTNTDL